MPQAKTPFFYAKPDGSDGFVNVGEEIPEGVDAGDNVRTDESPVFTEAPKRSRRTA